MSTHAQLHGHEHGRALRESLAQGDAVAGRVGPRIKFAEAWPWAVLGLVGVAAVLVFWLFEALPFMDLPAHAGLIAMRHRFLESPFEREYYVLAPHIGPYSLFRFLGEAFTDLASATGAVRALATLPVVATPAALLFARRRLHGDKSPTFGFLGIALSFGLMTMFGFASYLLGVAVMLVGLTLWLDLLTAVDESAGDEKPARRREIVVALFAPLMFVAHGHAFLLFLVMAGLSTLATGARFRRILRLRALAPAIALAAYVAWIERGTSTPAGSVAVPQGEMTPHFQSASDKLSLLITPTLMTRSGIDAALGLVIWAMVIAAVVATARSLKSRAVNATASEHIGGIGDLRSRAHSRALLACAAAVTVLFAVLPHSVGWFGFVDGRLVLVILLLALMAIRRPSLGKILRPVFDRGAPVIAATMVALALVASYRFQGEASGYREVLAQVPANVRLLNLPLDPDSDIFTAHPFVHYDKLVMVERPIVVSDVWFHQGSALYPTPRNPALGLPATYCESDLRGIDWPNYKLGDWDYVLIRTRPQASDPIVATNGPAGELAYVAHQGGWWLYRRN